jgi:hypothetical protein
VTQVAFDKIRDGMVQRNLWIPEVIPSAKAGQVEAFASPKGMAIKKRWQLGQIEIHEKQAILKHVRPRPESPVPDGSLVNTTMHGLFHI